MAVDDAIKVGLSVSDTEREMLAVSSSKELKEPKEPKDPNDSNGDA